jgi:predicted DsbA family dithiol-disulfide isomerase
MSSTSSTATRAPRTQWVTDDLIHGIGAAVPGLDTEQMVAEQRSDTVSKELAAAAHEATTFGISSTPSFLIEANGQKLQRLNVESLEPEPYREAIDSALGQ